MSFYCILLNHISFVMQSTRSTRVQVHRHCETRVENKNEHVCDRVCMRE